MKRLVCEVCGGTDLIKDEGVFACQSCGCKYTIEEVRKMMVEGTVDVQGTVKIDRAEEQKQTIDNYLVLLKNAHYAKDTAGVVGYSDKILTIDPENYIAWFYRALSAGWDSSLNNMKTGQVITAAKRAVSLAPQELKCAVAERIFTEARIQIRVHLNTVFSLTPKAVSTLSIVGATLTLSKQLEVVEPVMRAWIDIVRDIPCLSVETMEEEARAYKDMCSQHSVILGDTYYRKMDEAIGEKIRKAREEEKESIKTYWENNAGLKEELETQMVRIRDEEDEVRKSLYDDPEYKQYHALKGEVSSWERTVSSLGVFKNKEKKELQAKIDAAHKTLEQQAKVIKAKEKEQDQAFEKLKDEKKKVIERLNNPLKYADSSNEALNFLLDVDFDMNS